MDERRDTPAPAGRRRPPIAAAASRLTPSQEAWRAYVHHSLHECDTCRAADGSPCQAAEDLYAAWTAISKDAMRQIMET